MLMFRLSLAVGLEKHSRPYLLRWIDLGEDYLGKWCVCVCVCRMKIVGGVVALIPIIKNLDSLRLQTLEIDCM